MKGVIMLVGKHPFMWYLMNIPFKESKTNKK